MADNYIKYGKREITKEEYLTPGQHLLVVGKVRKLKSRPDIKDDIIPFTLTKINDEKWSMISDVPEPVLKDVLMWKWLGFLIASILLWVISISLFIGSLVIAYA